MILGDAPEAGAELAVDVASESPACADPRADVASLLAGLVTALLWGSSFVAIRVADKMMSPGAIALGRLVASSVVLGTVALVRREPVPSRRDLARIAAYGILWMGVYSVTLNEAERLVDAGTAAMLIGTGPLLIALLAGVFLREGFPRWLCAGCALAFAGSSIIGFATSQAGSHAASGIAFCLIAALAYSVAVVVQKPVADRVSAFQVTGSAARRQRPCVCRSGHHWCETEPRLVRRRSRASCILASCQRRSASRRGRSPFDGQVPAAWAPCFT